MDTSHPPIRCDQCGEPVWEYDQYRWAVARADSEEEGEPGEVVGQVLVHEDSWSGWAKDHGVEE